MFLFLFFMFNNTFLVQIMLNIQFQRRFLVADLILFCPDILHLYKNQLLLLVVKSVRSPQIRHCFGQSFMIEEDNNGHHQSKNQNV